MTFNKQCLDNLEVFVNEINASFNNNAIDDHQMLSKISSDDTLLRLSNILNQVKKTNISKILKGIDGKNNTSIAQRKLDPQKSQSLSKEEALGIFNDLHEEEIAKRYELCELEQMHLSVLGCKPLSKNRNKKGIINSITNYIYRTKRANDFK